MDLCTIYSRHCLHAALKVINLWCRSHSAWLRMSGPKVCNFQYGPFHKWCKCCL